METCADEIPSRDVANWTIPDRELMWGITATRPNRMWLGFRRYEVHTDPRLPLARDCPVALLYNGEFAGVGQIATKSFPKCKEFRIRWQDGSLSLRFDTKHLSDLGGWRLHDGWALLRVTAITGLYDYDAERRP